MINYLKDLLRLDVAVKGSSDTYHKLPREEQKAKLVELALALRKDSKMDSQRLQKSREQAYREAAKNIS